ncbi:hypothetical protein BV20DRAFT_476184 [Pilatotrama ljubarskyi]|nr:hypothetical protein BV20DRAFT_476184 [Pilatotrama ljubarskyi]
MQVVIHLSDLPLRSPASPDPGRFAPRSFEDLLEARPPEGTVARPESRARYFYDYQTRKICSRSSYYVYACSEDPWAVLTSSRIHRRALPKRLRLLTVRQHLAFGGALVSSTLDKVLFLPHRTHISLPSPVVRVLLMDNAYSNCCVDAVSRRL